MASRNDQITRNLEILHRAAGIGGYRAQAFEMLYGINYRATGIALPANTDQVGMTFYTKPNCNLQEENVTQDRHFSPLISRSELTYPRAIRAYLDPWGSENSGYTTPLVNNRQAFITALTNTVTSVSGFPDPIAGNFTAREGILGESYGMIDGIYEINGPWDMTSTFNNVEGGLIMNLFDTWVRYGSAVYQGTLMPYPWNNMMHRIDYMTRPYRFILDPARQYVQYWSAAAVAFPVNVPWGGVMDFDSNDNFSKANEKVSIQFKCFGAIYNDPILLDEFNRTVAHFNPDLKIANASTLYKEDIKLVSNSYYKVTPDQRDYMNYYCYPLVHPYTQELCWYVEKSVYKEKMDGLGAGAIINLDYTVPKDTADDIVSGYMSGTLDTE